jgi:hypothetical protein
MSEKIKIINCCGYGNTGCTAQTDFLGDHKGVVGALQPFHELGFLKCYYSFAGIYLSIVQNWSHIPTKQELKASLLGTDPQGPVKLNEGAKWHLELRKLLLIQNGNEYISTVENAVDILPNNYKDMDIMVLLPYLREAVGQYVSGLVSTLNLKNIKNSEDNIVIGFKNDPPGSYPIFSTMLMGGKTSAILRDPRDTTYDFNRHYKLGHTMENVINHCAHYNSQINSARAQIKKFEKVKQFEREIFDSYKVIDFENFVSSSGLRERYKDYMIGACDQIRFNFQPEQSIENIGHYKNMPDNFIRYIEEHCMQNYTNYREFLKDRGMLFD